MVAQTSPAIKKATVRLIELSADEKARQLYEARRKEQHDLISARHEGRLEGRHEGRQEMLLTMVKNALQMQVSMEEIVKFTGLTHTEIEALVK